MARAKRRDSERESRLAELASSLNNFGEACFSGRIVLYPRDASKEPISIKTLLNIRRGIGNSYRINGVYIEDLLPEALQIARWVAMRKGGYLVADIKDHGQYDKLRIYPNKKAD